MGVETPAPSRGVAVGGGRGEILTPPDFSPDQPTEPPGSAEGVTEEEDMETAPARAEGPAPSRTSQAHRGRRAAYLAVVEAQMSEEFESLTEGDRASPNFGARSGTRQIRRGPCRGILWTPVRRGAIPVRQSASTEMD